MGGVPCAVLELGDGDGVVGGGDGDGGVAEEEAETAEVGELRGAEEEGPAAADEGECGERRRGDA